MAEPDLMRWLPTANEADSEPLGAAASDVPVDARLVATGRRLLLPAVTHRRARARTALAFFTFPSDTFPAARHRKGDPKAGSWARTRLSLAA